MNLMFKNSRTVLSYFMKCKNASFVSVISIDIYLKFHFVSSLCHLRREVDLLTKLHNEACHEYKLLSSDKIPQCKLYI